MDTTDIEFKAAFQRISQFSQVSREKLPPYILLKLYAFYKQAKYGDNNPDFIDTKEIDLKNGFQLNAWIQLKGMSAKNSKLEYINIVKNL
jgi:acyl-CoA-binding protein